MHHEGASRKKVVKSFDVPEKEVNGRLLIQNNEQLRKCKKSLHQFHVAYFLSKTLLLQFLIA